MAYDLVAMARLKGIRRNLTFRPIEPTQANAQDLASLYLAVLKAWDAASILRGYGGMMTDAMFTDAPADQASAIAGADREATRLILEFTSGLRDWILRIERWHRAKWTAAVESSTTINLSSILTTTEVTETMEAFLERNVALVRNVSDQARGRISDAVFRGYQERRPAREVAKDISEATGLARKRSLGIASDQNSKISAALDRTRRDEAGLSLFRYRHSGKLHPRPKHEVRNGKIYDSATGKQVEADGSPMTGGDVIAADDRPGMPPWCGCREQAYLPLMGELGI